MISYKDITLKIFSYSSQADYNFYRVIAHFVPNFVAMATGVGGRKCDWQHLIAHPQKSPYRCKNLADVSYTDRVLSQILFHGNGCRSEKFLRIFHPFARKPPWRDLHEILHDGSPRRCNQRCQILSQSGQGF